MYISSFNPQVYGSDTSGAFYLTWNLYHMINGTLVLLK